VTRLRSPALLSLLLGAAAACGFAPLELWPLTLACIAVWLRLVHDAPAQRAALWRGWCFGVGHFTINDNWFQHAFDFQDRMPPVLGYAAPLALALYLAVFPMIAAGLAWRLASPRALGDARTPPGWAFACVAGAAWILTEWLRATLFTGYAWDPLAVIWVPVQPAARVAALVGTYALSGLTVALAGAVLALRRRRWPAVAGGLALLLAGQALGYRGGAEPARAAALLRVAQPNVGLGPTGQPDAELLLYRLRQQSGRPGPLPRLVLWPEGVLRDMIEDGYPRSWYFLPPAYQRRRLAALLGPRDILMAGGDTLRFDAEERPVDATNAVFVLDAAARIRGRYDKAHLVPYGEYLPMPWLLRPLGLARLVPGDLDFRPGPGPRTLAVPGFGGVGVQVCYEIIFSGQVVDRAHRPRFLFNPSNDAWFGRWGPPQHLAQARMRAIEEGLPVVRATPTGISAVVAADGRLLATVPHERAGFIELPIPAAGAPTPFARAGNWLALLVGLALVASAIALRRRGG
jgi:apolipoprotein N-acyltransferase